VRSDGSARALPVSLNEAIDYGRLNQIGTTGKNGAIVAFTYLGATKD